MRLAFLFIIIVLLISCAPARVSRVQSPYPSAIQEKDIYIVKRGDTLWEISRKFGVRVDDLKNANNIRYTNEIDVGQKLRIPFSRRTSRSSNFVWPARGEIINFFGDYVNSTINYGINIKTSADKSVRSSTGGKVVFSNYLKGWGKTVIVEHPNRFYTIYANLKSVSAKEGRQISKNTIIGEVAPSDKGEYILHFEIRKNYIPQDPLKYLR